MFTRLIKMQLTAFAVIAVVATAVVIVQYLKLPRLMGFQQYHVSAEITDATGIYVGALVTLRGVEVGKVAGLALHGTGARLDLSLDDSTSIPADVHATIRSSTAVGEQYVELTSGTDQPPFLQAGTVIPADRTTPQEPITNMLTSVTELARAVPADSSAVLLDEMSTAFQGAEQDIRELLSHGDTIVSEAVDHADSSGEVFRELPPFLQTQSSVNADVQSLTRDLASFTAQLAQSDHDLRAVVDNAPTTATAITDLEAGISQSLPVLLDNLTSTGEVLRLQIPGLTQSLVLYPAVVAALQTAFIHTDEGTSIRLRVRTTANDPPPCYEGFNPLSEQRAWEDVSPAPQPADMYCKVAQDDPRDVRGARNTPCANDQELRTPYFEECLGRPRGSQPVPVGSVPPVALSSPGFPALPPSSPAPAAAPTSVPDGISAGPGLQAQTSDWKTSYDPRTGLLSGPDGRLYLLGTVSAKEEDMEKETWKNLILK